MVAGTPGTVMTMTFTKKNVMTALREPVSQCIKGGMEEWSRAHRKYACPLFSSERERLYNPSPCTKARTQGCQPSPLA